MSYLALDTASRKVSVALGGVDTPAPTLVRVMEQTSSSKELLPGVQSLLAEAETDLSSLSGILAVRGPGSFTGIRVGLATVLGFHQALGTPATALGSLEILSTVAGSFMARTGPATHDGFWAAVWALRDEWYLQRFESASSVPAGLPVRWTRERWMAQLEEGSVAIVGHDLEELVSPLGDRAVVIPSPPLAVVAVETAHRLTHWDAAHLSDPLYVQGPSVTLPARPTG